LLGRLPLSSPSPTRWKSTTRTVHSGVSCHQCACTLAHRVIHRAEFFTRATCQRHRLRQLALGLARKLERLGGLFVVLPERGHGFFISCCALSCLGFPRLVGGGSLSACRSESPSILLKGNTPAGRSPLVTQGGQLCSKWWIMRETRQPRDTLQWRDSEESRWRGGDEYNRKPLCVYETL
jgi:hypothetical protein